MQRAFPDYRIVSAGVSGFGTDQEYLMLRRLWDRLNPTTVVLIFCSDNDRGDNSHNLAYQGYYKPYFAVGPRGAELHGLPIPISWRYYWKNEWFNRHFAVARLMTDLYIRLRHPRINVPDPTKSLVTLIRQFVVDHGARFAVGIEGTDAKLAAFLRAQSIPFVSLDGAERFSNDPYGQHWTAKGQVFVATRMEEFLPQIGAVASPPQRPVVADQAKPTR